MNIQSSIDRNKFNFTNNYQALSCISKYNKEQIDSLIDTYFDGYCPLETRIKIYCYIAVCGLLWSNWCEYKEKLGVMFCEYAYRQYQYAKDFFDIVQRNLIN